MAVLLVRNCRRFIVTDFFGIAPVQFVLATGQHAENGDSGSAARRRKCARAAIVFIQGKLVRSRGLEPPRVAPLAPQASASTNSATTAGGSTPSEQVRRPGNGADVTNRLCRHKSGRGACGAQACAGAATS